MAEKKENRGGARPGSGRKPRFVNSDAFIEQLLTAELAAVADGRPTVAEVIIDLATGADSRVAAQMCKLYADKVVAGASEQETTVTKHEGPGVLLPPELPDVAAEDPAIH